VLEIHRLGGNGNKSSDFRFWHVSDVTALVRDVRS
jgi:hypothetical protein